MNNVYNVSQIKSFTDTLNISLEKKGHCLAKAFSTAERILLLGQAGMPQGLSAQLGRGFEEILLVVQSSLEEQILPEKSVAEDFYSVSLFCLFHYCSLCSLPLDLNSDMSFWLRLSHPLPHLLDFWKNGMDFFFFLTYALRKYIVLKHQPILLIFW